MRAFSVTTMPFPIQRTFKIVDNRCEMFFPEYFHSRSQDLEEAYQDAGQFYWEKVGSKSDEIMFGKDSIPIILPRYLVQDIDTMEDWKRAEVMYQALNQDRFDEWNRVKKSVHKLPNINFNEREIVFISMGQNVGFEQYGKGEEFLRPVVILKKFNKQLFFGIPLSKQLKNGYLFHQIKFRDRVNWALLLQARTFDSKRIKYRLAKLSHNEFEKLKKRFKEVVTPLPDERGSA
jgi:hypothetical protein